MSRLRLLVLAISAVLFLLSGDNAGGVRLTTAAMAAPTKEASASAPVASAAWSGRPSTAAVDELSDDLRSAIDASNAYWATHWSNFFAGRYSPPRMKRALGLYDGYGRYAPTCKGRQLGPNNAWYCPPPEDFLAWDVTFLKEAYIYGDGFVYLVVAHEWGHAVQWRLHYSLVPAQRELQADCLAGAALYGSARDGRLRFEAGDEAEIARTLTATADATPWTNVNDHGTPSQRIAVFRLGRNYGVRACFRDGRTRIN